MRKFCIRDVVGGAGFRIWCHVRHVGTRGPYFYDNRRRWDCSKVQGNNTFSPIFAETDRRACPALGSGEGYYESGAGRVVERGGGGEAGEHRRGLAADRPCGSGGQRGNGCRTPHDVEGASGRRGRRGDEVPPWRSACLRFGVGALWRSSSWRVAERCHVFASPIKSSSIESAP